MMKSFSIAVKDMRLLIGDRGTLIYLFLLPFVFIFVFSGALAGFAGEDEDQAIPLPVVNLDPDGAAAAALLAEIEAAGGLRVELLAEDEAEQMMADEEIDRVLWIPAGFSSDIAAGREATLRLVNQNNADSAATEGARLVIAGAAQDLALETQLVASLEQFGAMQGPTEDAQSISTETMIAQAQDQIARAEERPLINVTQQLPEQEGEDTDLANLDPIQFTVPGFTVLFIFITAQTTARSIYDEKKFGSFRRLLAAPLSKLGLLSGKMLPNFLMVLIQVVVIFGVAALVLPLLGLAGLDLGSQPLALVPVVVLVALCSTTLGIVIAALARTENQIGGLSTLIIWVTGILGGAMIPSFLFPDLLNQLGQVVPQYWAIRAFNKLLVFDAGLADITTELGMLLVFAVIFLVIGLWRFDFD